MRRRGSFNVDVYDSQPLYPGQTATWNAQLICHSILSFPGEDDSNGAPPPNLEKGDKVLLPSSALMELSLRQIEFPIVLQLRNPANNKLAYCGVLEFSSPEQHCCVPFWMKEALELEEGQRIHLRTVNVPKGTYAKLQPLTDAFYHLDDPKAVLESLLRGYTCLKEQNTFQLMLTEGSPPLSFRVLALKPEPAVCIVDTNIEVEFAPMEGRAMHGPVGEERTTLKERPPMLYQQMLLFLFVATVPLDRRSLHEAVCYRQNWTCDKCSARLPRSNIQSHLNESHALVNCKCGDKMERYLLEEHKRSECLLRTVKCSFCGVSILAKERLDHETYCGSRTEKCEICSHWILLRDFENHQLNECEALRSTTPTSSQQQQEEDHRAPTSSEERKALKSSAVVCPICYKGFPQLDQLYSHLELSHSGFTS
ncbi:Ubiquitin fusion degradation protein 1 [Balamuthia mandrillaris]